MPPCLSPLRRLRQEGSERGADGATPQRLLHPEVVHHALLDFLLGRGEQEAPEDRQLEGKAWSTDKNVQILQSDDFCIGSDIDKNSR